MATTTRGRTGQSPTHREQSGRTNMATHPPATLIVTSGKLKGRQVHLSEPEVFIGRDDTCKIRIASKEVSREHCVILKQDNDVLVRDLNSRNGTFVNGMIINGVTLLRPGDTLHIGPMIFELAGAKKTVAVVGHRASAVNLRAERNPLASDNDIASWLKDDEEEMTASEVSGDTHYVSSSERVALAQVETPPETSASASRVQSGHSSSSVSSELDEATRLAPSIVSSQDDEVASRMAAVVRTYWIKKT